MLTNLYFWRRKYLLNWKLSYRYHRGQLERNIMHPCLLRDCKTGRDQILVYEKNVPNLLILKDFLDNLEWERVGYWFFGPQIFTSSIITAHRAMRMQSISFESPWHYSLADLLFKSVGLLLRCLGLLWSTLFCILYLFDK